MDFLLFVGVFSVMFAIFSLMALSPRRFWSVMEKVSGGAGVPEERRPPDKNVRFLGGGAVGFLFSLIAWLATGSDIFVLVAIVCWLTAAFGWLLMPRRYLYLWSSPPEQDPTKVHRAQLPGSTVTVGTGWRYPRPITFVAGAAFAAACVVLAIGAVTGSTPTMVVGVLASIAAGSVLSRRLRRPSED